MSFEQYVADNNLHQLDKRIYKDTADRITQIVAGFGNRSITEYLRGRSTAHNLSLQN